MRRTVSFVVAWLLVAGLALSVAWRGVGAVNDRVTTSRPAPLSADEVREQLAAAPTSTATSPPTTSSKVAPDPSVVSSTSAPPPTTTSVAPPPSTASTLPPTATAPAVQRRTYTLVGGDVALLFSPDGVTVEYAIPDAGYELDVDGAQGNGVRVEFESDDHRSRVEGWWDSGPQERVDESADGDSGDDD